MILYDLGENKFPGNPSFSQRLDAKFTRENRAGYPARIALVLGFPEGEVGEGFERTPTRYRQL